MGTGFVRFPNLGRTDGHTPVEIGWSSLAESRWFRLFSGRTDLSCNMSNTLTRNRFPDWMKLLAIMTNRSEHIGHRLSDISIRTFIGAMHLLPYERRIHIAGLATTHTVARMFSWRRRIRENLTLILPELPRSEAERLVRMVPYHMGRTLMELYSPSEFVARVRRLPLTGPGAEALEEAYRNGRGVVLVTGHYGNYDAVRAALIARGYQVGGHYKAMSNPFFNSHYVATISKIGKPLFRQGRSGSGMRAMIRFLRAGGMVGFVLDQRINNAPILEFMGKPARTSVAAAELALRYDALVVPCYGIRTSSGTYDVVIEDPIPHSSPEEMTQSLNNSLEARVRASPEQWMWTHRRWENTGSLPRSAS